MSQLTATARPLHDAEQALDHGPSHGTHRSGVVTPLRVLPARIAGPGNGAFATMCAVLLTVGLIALLLLNTALAQGSLELGQLQRESSVLGDTASNLQEQIDQASSSGVLAKKAALLGMVRANERAYIDVAKGKVTGTAYPASKAQAFPIITSPTPVPKPSKTAAAPKPAGTATPAPAATPTNQATTPTGTPTGTAAPTTTAGATGNATTPKPSPSPSTTTR